MTTSSAWEHRGTRGRAATGVVAAVVLAACGNQVAGQSSDLPLLRIGTGTPEVAAAAAGSAQSAYPLEGTLPQGPSSAPVYRYGDRRLPASDISTLARALGVTGTPVRHAHGWEVTSPSGIVRVHDGGTAWSWSRSTTQCPSYVVDIDNTGDGTVGSGCAVAVSPSGPGSGTTPRTIDAATALAAARPVLAAVGLTYANAVVLPGTSPRTVVVDPVVDGRTTVGVRTSVDVGPAGAVGAIGVLSTPTIGDTYPIVTATAALDLLRAMPQPEIAMACAQGAVCPGVGPRVVTGARLGLTFAYDGGAPLLVPAWLFSIRGSDDPVAVVAVERRYLADPTPAPDDGATAPGSSAVPGPGWSPGSEPPASASDLPTTVTAPPPAVPPSAPEGPTSGSGTTGSTGGTSTPSAATG